MGSEGGREFFTSPVSTVLVIFCRNSAWKRDSTIFDYGMKSFPKAQIFLEKRKFHQIFWQILFQNFCPHRDWRLGNYSWDPNTIYLSVNFKNWKPLTLPIAVFLFSLLERACPFAVPCFSCYSFFKAGELKNSKNSDKGLQFKINPHAKIWVA